MKMKKLSKIRPEILDALLEHIGDPSDILNDRNAFLDLKKALIEKALEGEMTHHLGYPKHGNSLEENTRNGYSEKILATAEGQVPLTIPRDRAATFTPQLIQKHQRRVKALDDRIIALYARGMSMRDIQGYLQELYGTDVSPELISSVTDAVMEEVTAWQNRPLDSVYPIVYLDATMVKVHEDHRIINKSLYIALGINLEGHKEVLGLWIAQTEGAKFWLQVMTELKNRGLQEVYIACVDGLKGFPEAIQSVFPKTTIQLCIVHMIRNSLNYVPWKDRKAVAQDLKLIYTAPTKEMAFEGLQTFRLKWDDKYPIIADLWERHWQGIIPFFDFPPEIRKVIYTTNSVEALNRQIKKVTKTKGAFPNDQAVFKLVYLILQNASKKWTMPIREWKLALNQFAILYSDRDL
jgi:putative transposase